MAKYINYLNAHIYPKVNVAGYDLLPLSLGHLMKLEYNNSCFQINYIADEETSQYDFIIAIMICSRDWKQNNELEYGNKKDFTNEYNKIKKRITISITLDRIIDQLNYRFDKKDKFQWIRKLYPWYLNMKFEDIKFSEYYKYYISNLPEMHKTPAQAKISSSGQDKGAPVVGTILHHLVYQEGCSWEEAYNYPYSKARWNMAIGCEIEGRANIDPIDNPENIKEKRKLEELHKPGLTEAEFMALPL